MFLKQVAPFGTPPVGTANSYQQQPVQNNPQTVTKPLSGSTRRNFSHQQMERLVYSCIVNSLF